MYFPRLFFRAFPLVLLWAVFLVSPAESKAPDRWSVKIGIPEISGKTVTVSRDVWAGGPLFLSKAGLSSSAAFLLELQNVREAVGDYLPADEGLFLPPEVIFALCRMQAEYSMEGEGVFCPADRSGYAVDFVLTPSAGQRERESDTIAWMKENLWRFGFTGERTSNDKESAEAILRLRYVGFPHAAVMRVLSMDLDEYLLFLRHAGQITLCRNERPFASIQCFPEDDFITFQLPENAAFDVSGDGAGSVILTVTL